MRLNIRLSDELGQKVKLYSTKYGMTKSSFIAYAVGSHIQNLESQETMVKNFTESLTNVAQKGLINDSTENN